MPNKKVKDVINVPEGYKVVFCNCEIIALPISNPAYRPMALNKKTGRWKFIKPDQKVIKKAQETYLFVHSQSSPEFITFAEELNPDNFTAKLTQVEEE